MIRIGDWIESYLIVCGTRTLSILIICSTGLECKKTKNTNVVKGKKEKKITQNLTAVGFEPTPFRTRA